MSQHLIQLELPAHLSQLANAPRIFTLQVVSPVTQASLLDALELRNPMLRGTIRDSQTRLRRPYLRFFACNEDLSHDSPNTGLPPAVRAGRETFIILGAIAGG